jgi:adenylate cyclase
VIGDPVNEAARLCDVAKETDAGVAASGAALSRASSDEARRWTSTGSQHLRGRTAETEVLVPAGDRADPDPDSDSDSDSSEGSPRSTGSAVGAPHQEPETAPPTPHPQGAL